MVISFFFRENLLLKIKVFFSGQNVYVNMQQNAKKAVLYSSVNENRILMNTGTEIVLDAGESHTWDNPEAGFFFIATGPLSVISRSHESEYQEFEFAS